MKHYGDVGKINGSKIEPVDIITFGAPCQDLSVAGKRSGMKHEVLGDNETTRSGLFFEAIRIIKEMRESTNGEYPKYAVYENVPGAFSSNKGRDFHAVLEALCSVCDDTVSIPEPYDTKRTKLVWNKAGEIVGDDYSIAWRTLDAQYWGVPQRRKRIYLIADFTGRRAGEILFEPEGLRGDLQTGNEAGQEVTTDAVGGVDGSVGAIDAVGLDLYNQSMTGDVAKSLNSAATDSDHVPCVAYSFDSLSSNSMKSAVQLIILNDQGGSSINVESENLSPTLRANSHQHEPVIVLQANGIDRADTAGCNGCGWRENESYTLNTIDRHAVCYDANRKDDTYGAKIKTNTDKALQVLWREVGAEEIAKWGFRIFDSFQQKGVLQQGMYGECVSEGRNGFQKVDGSASNGSQEKTDGGLRGVWGEKCERCSPQGWEPSEQQIRELAAHLQELSQQNPSAESFLHYMRGTNEGVWLLRKALSKIQKTRQPICNKTQPTHRRYIIRRLTPTEAARLQGFPDWWGHLAPYNPADAEFWEEVRKTHAEINGKAYKPIKDVKKWYEKLHTDSAEYKAYGNGLALPNAEFVLHGIAEQGAKTLGSLFDGIGGFPLAGAMNGIKPLWASEVEPYPIAVTKSRFEEED